MSAIASRAGSTRNKLLWGELLIGLACGTVAMVQDISPFYRESIHAGDGWELAARATALCPLISFPDNFYQFNCRQTPLQTLVVAVIIETSSEH